MDKLLNKIKRLIPKKVFAALQPGYHFLLNWLASIIYRHPSESLIVIGITGTTGKTTSTYLIAKMLENAGYKVGYTSTAIFNNGKKEWLNDKKMTMLGRFFTQKILRQMVVNGCEIAIVETTSEGVKQFRHKFINYDTLIFTGLYPEHIESHGGFENYKQAKGKFFAHLKKCKVKYIDSKKKVVKILTGIKKLDYARVKKTIIVNGNDQYADFFLDFWAEEKIQYKLVGGKSKKEDIKTIYYDKVEVTNKGTSFIVDNNKINLQLIGDFNAENAMNAVSLGLSLEVPFEKIKEGLEKIKGVAGRLENINEGQNFIVIVDYAFEPNAITKLYEAVKLIPHKKIIHVLGSAGGGRDISRRPILGKLAGVNADVVIVTNEDPYDDDPSIIIDQVSLGAEQAGKKVNENLYKISDRFEAIKKAIDLALEDDIVLITGKGSEQAICVANGEKITWDDRAVVRGILNNDKNKN